jgi:hypothetical protein
VLRDITRGGIAGLIAGVLVAGLGGRVAMRLAALVVPGSLGEFTENGFRIGAITLNGSIGLILTGLGIGLGVGVVWVTIRPWIPGGRKMRVLLAMPMAVALGSFGLIQGENSDFAILERNPLVVGILVGLVALIGLAIALLDVWLDGRLPHATSLASAPAGIYSVVTLLGLLFGLPLVVLTYFREDTRTLGIALLVVGVATLASWLFRVRRLEAPAIIRVLGYSGLAAAVAIGFVGTWSEVTFALRIR